MVVCKCGKQMDKVPDWLQGVTVDFVCNNCPNRKTKNIAFINLDFSVPATDKVGAPEDLEAIVDEDDDAE